MSFSENLKRLRERAGYMQAKDLSNYLGMPYSTYMSYENMGKEPRFDTLIRIATALHCTIDELLGYELDEYEKVKKIAFRAGYDILDGENNTVKILASDYDYNETWGDNAEYLAEAHWDLTEIFDVLGIKDAPPDFLVYPTKEDFCKAIHEAIKEYEKNTVLPLHNFITRKFANDYKDIALSYYRKKRS